MIILKRREPQRTAKIAENYLSIPNISRSVTSPKRSPPEFEIIRRVAAISGRRVMTSESILGLETNRPEIAETTPNNSSVDARLNTLRETVLLLLEEVESLAISKPVDIKNGARFSDEVKQFEVSLIRTALGRTSGSQTRAAKLLGLKPTTLNAKIKRYGIMA